MSERDEQRRQDRDAERAERDRNRRIRRQRPATPTGDYRVPLGRIAMTFDIEGSDPGTIEIDAASLTDVVAEITERVAGLSYQRVLQMLGGIHRAWEQGQAGTENGLLLGFWAALHHPASGDAMRRKIAERMANGEPVHITMYAGRSGGIAFAMGDRFADLAELSRWSKAAKIGVAIAEATAQSQGTVH